MVDGLRLVPPQAGTLVLARPAPDVLRQLNLRRVLHDADIDSVEAIAVRGSSRAKAANTFSDWLIAAVRRVQGRRDAESPEFERAGLHGLDQGAFWIAWTGLQWTGLRWTGLDCMDCMDWTALDCMDCMEWTALDCMDCACV